MNNDFEIHARENNDASEDFLNENYDKFSKQCIYVLKILKRGERLSVPKALGLGIMSLPRRIMDLKINGIEIKDEWIKDSNGKRIMKEWFIEVPKPPTKEDLQTWFTEFQNGRYDDKPPTPVINIHRKYYQQNLF